HPGRARRLQPGLERLPGAAAGRRPPAPARAGERREEGRGAHGPGRPDALEGDQGQGRARHGAPGGAAAGRAAGGAAGGAGAAAPDADVSVLRGTLGSFLFSGDAVQQPARTLSGGEKTRLALAVLVVSAANVLLLDEPTNNLDPASREEVLTALSAYRGAVLL